MSSSLVTLERELERAALDFAGALVLAALRAKVEELPMLRREALLLAPDHFPIEVTRRASGRRESSSLPEVRAASGRAKTRREPREAEPKETRESSDAPRREPRAAKTQAEREPRTRARAKLDEPEGDDGAHTITDPTLLLAAIESDAQPAPSRAHAARSSSLLSAAEEETGPALRPGERVQRSAGGTVILRRGRG